MACQSDEKKKRMNGKELHFIIDVDINKCNGITSSFKMTFVVGLILWENIRKF